MKAKDAPSKIVWQGRSWRLRVFQQATHAGHTLERGIIEHPGSVVIVPVQDDRVLMLSQYRLALDKTILELPAGTRNWDEEWQACAERELREETGYRGAKWISFGKVWPAPGITDELMAIYLATDMSWDPLPADEDEEIEVQSLRINQAIDMALDGQLMDAKSIVGILRARSLISSD